MAEKQKGVNQNGSEIMVQSQGENGGSGNFGNGKNGKNGKNGGNEKNRDSGMTGSGQNGGNGDSGMTGSGQNGWNGRMLQPGEQVTGAQRHIQRRNLIYYTIYPYVRSVFFQYYSRVEVNGVENIPRDAAVIFAPNHQNALMDALIVLFSAPGDVVFLARADIFSKKFMAYLLNSLKILPVFRQRDGSAELSKNQEIFDISVNVLKGRHNLCIMPEGSHGDKRVLRPLVKGIFRIAFTAQEPHGEAPFVKIVPVGLDFGHYVKQNQTLLINFGKPIEVSDFWEQYGDNPARGINGLRGRLADEMKQLMIHVSSEKYYDMVLGLRTIFNDRMREILGIEGDTLTDRFRADKEMIHRLERLMGLRSDKIAALADRVHTYFRGVEEMKIRDWVARDGGYGFFRGLWRYLFLVVTFPVFLYGLINNALPYFLPVYFSGKIKDVQFHSSVKAGLGILILFPVFYLLQTLLVGLLTGPWWIWAAYLLSLYPGGKAALYWYFGWKKTVRGTWFNRRLRRKDPNATRLVSLRREIIDLTEELVKA